jgi:acyl dehydratase
LFADLNPLHVDPVVAHQAGFDRPILHGLCTYGVICRAVIQACMGGDASRMGSLAGKFTAPVMPGDNLRIEIWKDTQNPAQTEGQQNLKIRCSVPERQSVVFSNATASVSVP